MSDAKIAVATDLLAVSKAYVNLSTDKRRLFRMQLRERGIRSQKLPIVPFPDRGAAFPLSHAQERMWFLWRLEPSSAAYNITGAVRLQGSLDRGALRIALDRIVERHESLRKRFSEEDGVPMQIVGPAIYGWREFDLAEEVSLSAKLDTLANEPFDLVSGPLLRAALLRCADDEHVLHIALHHIVADGLSIDVFVEEFAAAYRVACGAASETPTGRASSIQYGDYARWQREWLDEAALADQLGYWRAQLGGEHPALELPFARARSGLRNAAGGQISRFVAPHVVRALRSVAHAGDATLFMILLAAYDVLLSRYSGQSDIRVGIPVSGRDREETARVIGFFVNTLVLRAQLQGLTHFGELLAQVRTCMLAAHARQDVPFARLVEELQPQRSLGQTPLFQTLFNYLGEAREFSLPGLQASVLEVSTGTARFDLVLSARERCGGLEVSLTYARDVLEESTVERMLGHYVALLEQVASKGDVPLGELVLEAQVEHRSLASHAFVPVGERIAVQARRRAQANAVHCEGERLSYGELEAWSNRIARALHARGVRAETRVGVCLERSAGLVAALLGVLKSGGAFVPLDPTYPAERLVLMMEDAAVSYVLSDAATWHACGALFEGRAVLDIAALEAWSGEAVRIGIDPEQLAYVIYTSGSTGRPKGVAVSQVALSRHLDDFIETYGIDETDTQLQSSTINFDVALHELLPALIQGGQVELRGARLWDIETMSRRLAEGRVTFSRIPTAYWQQWLRSPPAASELARLRQITVGGEGLPGDALAQWRRGPLAHIRLDNLYGPTETTVACMYRKTRASDTEQAIVSIGEPYGSRWVYVMDRYGNEVPVGALGELCIGGLTLARGYLNRPGLSAEKFVPDPRQAGARLYRSGDLCRRRPDGSIDFLGRLDQQVKLRGFRIEPGEIEAALRQIAGVRAAVVSLVGEGEARQLVGYVVGTVEEGVLRRTLEARLPGYMVPSAFVRLEALPLMPNGKVDRAALPAPGFAAARPPVAPRTVLEGELLAIWQAVLKRDGLSVMDNFFEVGGHSLLLMQVASRIRQELGREVSLQALFLHPVLASLAAELEAQEVRAVEAIAARAPGSRIPLTYAQERLWFLWNMEPDSAAYTIAGAVWLTGVLDTQAMRRALDRLVARHESLRTRFVEQDGQTWQVVEAAARYAWRRESISDRDALEARLLALSQAPFDLSRGPVLRITLLDCAPTETVLHFAMPHIVSDAWSQAILLSEFSQLYRAASRNEPVELACLPIQYGDYALWQRTRWDEAALEVQYAYWERELGGESPLLELPVDRVRHGARGSAGARVERPLDAALTQALERRSREHEATRFMTMLAAFAVLLQRYSGQDDIRIGVPVAGRDRLETEALIGFFVNTLVIRLTARGTQPFSAWLAEARERVLGAQAHAQVPFAKLVDRLQPQRSVSHTPLFQVLFNYGGESRAQIELPGIEARTLAGGTGTAQFDLSLEVLGEADSVVVALSYATDIFDRDTVARLLDDYVAVLEQVASRPEVRPAQIALRGVPSARRTELKGYEFVPVARRIAQQAARTPAAIAVRCGDQKLSYAELDTWSDAIAARLRARNVQADERIGVCVGRSVGLLAAVLGVLKSGAAYVPLDPAFPAERLMAMLDDAKAACIVADEASAAQLGAVLGGRRVLRLDRAEARGDRPTRRERSSIHPAQLAYVIYTSGSTGKPKGVGISHEALDRFLASLRGRLGVEAHDVWLSVTTLSFDIAALELYLPLLSGACIELARREDVTDGVRLARLLECSEATILQATPMGWKVLLEGGWAGVRPPGRGLRGLCGGEALPRELAGELQARGVDLWNLYGPTETTIWSSLAHLGCELPPVVALGEAIEGTTLRLIDGNGGEVPQGGIGELCIGGTNLARGYLNRAALSARCFVPDPQGGGGRLYRTGDLCRRNAQGDLIYIGRADQQVKLRGFRIELGEVEAALRCDAGVRDAAAAVKTVAGQPMLVGYVVGAAGTAPAAPALRAQLAQRLAPYMVPQCIVALDVLPLTPNGKLDRNALPAPSPGGESYAEPRTKTERVLANIWQSVLGVAQVSAHDDFFALGGQSLTILKVARLAREAGLAGFGIESLFARPVLGELAAHIDAWGERVPANIVPMNSSAAALTVFAIHPAYGLIAEYRALARYLDGSVSVLGVQSPLYSDPHWWVTSLDSLAEDYAKRIRQVQPQGPYRLIGWSMGGLLAVEIAHRLEASGETVAFLGLIDAGMQARADHDLAAAQQFLRARRNVSEQEIESFWSDADDDRHKWRRLLGAAADDPVTIGNVVLAIEQLKALTANWRMRRVSAPLTIWWASESVGSTLDEKTARWRRCSSSDAMLADVIDTDHPGIVQHPALFASLAQWLQH